MARITRIPAALDVESIRVICVIRGLQVILDRHGMRLTQLGTILNMVAPFVDAGSPSESA
jgi:hypothetical protein